MVPKLGTNISQASLVPSKVSLISCLGLWPVFC